MRNSSPGCQCAHGDLKIHRIYSQVHRATFPGKAAAEELLVPSQGLPMVWIWDLGPLILSAGSGWYIAF